jgi:hypothetical protein
MANLRIVLNRKGVHALLTSEKVKSDLERRAHAVAAAADAASGRGGDHAVESGVGKNRARASVYTDTFNAMHRESEQRTLTRAIDAARA